MKIVNKKFHDYYDCCMGYGIDKTIIFNRIRNEYNDNSILTMASNKFLKETPKRWYQSTETITERLQDKKDNNYLFESGVVGFCGMIYPFLRVIIEKKFDFTYCNDHSDKQNNLFFIYDYESYFNFMKRFNLDSDNILMKFDAMRKYFTRFDELDFFFKLKAPLFINIPENEIFTSRYTKRRLLIVNANLSDVQFYKAVDSFSAFQKISSFIGGVLCINLDVSIEISDKVKQHKHGFTHKYSFKKEPSKYKYK